jgi:hypothetical protein
VRAAALALFPWLGAVALATSVAELRLRGAPAGTDVGAAARRCSIAPLSPIRGRGATYLVGRGSSDTVRAGAGPVRYSAQRPGDSPTPAERIHGQVVLVQRVAGHRADEVERAFARRGRREAVIVPWGYREDCRPIAWHGSARWIDAAADGFLRLVLRPEVDWAGGRPTFDAYQGYWQPYPSGEFLRRGFRGTSAIRNGPHLTPAQLLDLYLALPDDSLVRHDRAAALAVMERWAAEHPELATRYPATTMLDMLRRVAAADR